MAEFKRTVGPAGLYFRLGGKLGVRRIRSDEDLASLVEKQLPAAAIKALVRGVFPTPKSTT